MTWLQIIFYIILNAPKLISLIHQIIDIIRGAPHSMQLSMKERLVSAIEAHKQNKDDAKLAQVCVGIGCASPLLD